MRRVSLCRGPWRRRKPPIGRRDGAPSPGPHWRYLTQRIMTRDQVCRFCGTGAGGGRRQVDHIIPRLLANPDWMNEEWNLAVLCEGHHGEKTSRIERALLRGDPYPFYRFLVALRLSGPVPDGGKIGEMLYRVQQRLER